MKEKGIDLYIIPTTDFHGSEYVNDYFKCREYVSGFTGSAGTMVVTQEWAGLWTDGRYFLQARHQLEGSGIELMEMGMPGVPEITTYIKEQLDIHTAKVSAAFISASVRLPFPLRPLKTPCSFSDNPSNAMD